MADKRFFWLKLKRDFFKRHDIRIIEAMPNGKETLLFYLKLLCESVDHDGQLRFNEQVPYTAEMLSVITNTDGNIASTALESLKQLGMLDIGSDGTIYMTECKKMIGSESEWADKKRQYRETKRGHEEDNLGQSEDNVQTMSDMKKTMSDKSKSKSKSIEKETEHKEKSIAKAIPKEKAELSPLDQALDDFAKMRVAIKKPMTERAKELLLAKLNRLAPTEEEKIAILNQSIEGGWSGIYPLKQDQGQQKPRYLTKGEQAAKDLQDSYDMIADFVRRNEGNENDDQGIWSVG